MLGVLGKKEQGGMNKKPLEVNTDEFCMKNINKSSKKLSIRLQWHGDVSGLKCCGTDMLRG